MMSQYERMAMGTCHAKTDSTKHSDNDMDADSHDNGRTLFDSLPFVTACFLAVACAFALPMTDWPLVAGFAVLAFISGQRLERRLAEDRLNAFRQAVLVSPSPPHERSPSVSLTKETG